MLPEKNSKNFYSLFPAFLAGIIIVATAFRGPIFVHNSLTMACLDQVLNYLVCLGQATTGRLVSHGNNISFGFGNLGPFVFYIYSLLLAVWTSPICLIAFSLVLSLAAPAVLFLFFHKRGEALTGAIAAALMLTNICCARIVGDTWPHIFLPFATVAWLFLFLGGLEKNSGPKFAASFIFLSLATNCHFTGFLLLPVALALWLPHKPRVGGYWGYSALALFLLPYTLFLIETQHRAGGRPVFSIVSGAKELARGGASGAGNHSALHNFLVFKDFYFYYLGLPFGLLSVAALAAGVYKMLSSRGKRGSDDVSEKLKPWILIQGAAFAALFAANNQSWYYLVYCVGSFGSAAILLRHLIAQKYSFLWAAAPLLFVFTNFCDAEYPTVTNRDSYFQLYSQTRNLISSGLVSPSDLSRVHVIPDSALNMGVNMEWFTAISATPFKSARLASNPSGADINYLFKFARSKDTELTRILKRELPGLSGKFYSPFKSRIDPDSWKLCKGSLESNENPLQNASRQCAKTVSSWRSDVYLERVVYEKFPELLAFRGHNVPRPHVEPGKLYTLVAEMKPAEKSVKNRLIIVQTTGIAGVKLLHNGLYYNRAGFETLENNAPDFIATHTWFVIPATPGEIAFDLRQKLPTPTAAPDNGLMLDVIDIDMAGQ